jgi:hypothetical protein
VEHVGQARAGKSVPWLDDFDAPTRAALEARAKAAAQATGELLPADAAYQLLQGPPPVPLAGVRVVDQSGEHATLEVAFDAGPPQRVEMVREGGRWKVHLPG